MLRVFTQKAALVVRSSLVATPLRVNIPAGVAPWARQMSGKVETDEEFDNRYVAYFNKPDIDGWEVRKGMNDLMGYDLVPEPKIIVAALKACRRLNDYSLTTRFLESIKFKCQVNPEIYPYVMKEIKPTLDELGISSPEELGYDKPELALKSVFDMHG